MTHRDRQWPVTITSFNADVAEYAEEMEALSKYCPYCPNKDRDTVFSDPGSCQYDFEAMRQRGVIGADAPCLCDEYGTRRLQSLTTQTHERIFAWALLLVPITAWLIIALVTG